MINRRAFIKTGLRGSALLAAALPAAPLLAKNQAALDLKIYATNWGFKGSLQQFCQRVKEEGYDGIELWLPEKSKVKQLLEAVDKYSLDYILLVGGHEKTYPENFASFKANLERALSLSPSLINCHTGRDYFSAQQAGSYFQECIQRSKESGVTITHETHRARILFAAHISQPFLKAYPELRLTLDISHWCNVAASLLEGQQAAVELALARSDHVHGRVGFAHGPQVNDPRAPEWRKAFAAHVAWWDAIVAIKRRSSGRLSMTTEFGPFPYMPTLPYTQQAVADQWDINRYMMNFWRERYSAST